MSGRPAQPKPRLVLLRGQWKRLNSSPAHLLYKPAAVPSSLRVTGQTHRAGGDSPSDSEAALKIR